MGGGEAPLLCRLYQVRMASYGFKILFVVYIKEDLFEYKPASSMFVWCAK